MKLYDNDAYREEFMALVYDLLHSDGTNDRANQIIYAFDMAPALEADPLLPNNPLTLKELREIIEQLEQCGYECEAGSLAMNTEFIRLKEFAYRRKPEETV